MLPRGSQMVRMAKLGLAATPTLSLKVLTNFGLGLAAGVVSTSKREQSATFPLFLLSVHCTGNTLVSYVFASNLI